MLLAVTPIALMLLAYGLYTGCGFFGVEQGSSAICSNAGLIGFIGFAWLPYTLFACAIAAILRLLVQRISKKS